MKTKLISSKKRQKSKSYKNSGNNNNKSLVTKISEASIKESLEMSRQNVFNIANLVTSLRIILAPIILVAMLNYDYTLALYLFIIASFSDLCDGKIARLMNSSSKFGAILDPIADVTLMVFTIIGLVITTNFPLWFVFIVVFREIIIILGGIVCLYSGNVSLAKADVVGKLSRFLQVISLLVFLLSYFDQLFVRPAYYIIYLTSVFTLVSAIIYLSRIREIIGSRMAKRK